ncbi:Gfo/Idh/MocA family protein [Puniceicoccus vermicola]|uniref:Gfo/Idh/MocA family oxidoreductase n=1 Tax=Puniceicoccus vermicola TaxID=388746 RepID=A0A7X1E4K3_9BACT|nr:Gfo/Idh/MocA family oxidoreductase [Puniceicoccus vermicola]MBC2602149.1 Gfo/Idh/MocA family oxidoreductase [Puniceicoccus vermicola]
MTKELGGAELSLPLRVGLIGVSGYGRCHYEAIRSLEEEGLVSLVAATVINPDEEVECCREMRANGCRIYDDYQTMIRCESGRTDLYCIPTGIEWHCQMTLDALEAGCHVLVEKPVAGSAEEAQAMREAEKHSGLRVFVGFQNLFADDLWKTKQLLVNGTIGTLRRVRVSALWPRGIRYYERTRWAGRLMHRGKAVFDSPVNNAMAHFIMMALFFSGTRVSEASRVRQIRAHLMRVQSIESFDTCSMELITESGVTVLVNMSHSTREYRPAELVLEGTEGECRWGEKTGVQFESGEFGKPKANHFPPFSNTRIVMLRHIVDQLCGGNSPVCSLELAKVHTEFVDKLHRSASIWDMDPSLAVEEERDGEPYRVVERLGEALLSAHDQGQLWEAGPWCAASSTSLLG